MNIENLKKSEFFEKKLRRVFDTLDSNNNNYISKADYEIVLKRFQDQGISEKRLEILKMIYIKGAEAMGVESNSKITFDQFKEITFKRMASPDSDEKFKKMVAGIYSFIDSSNSGGISLEEWKSYKSAMGVSPADAEASFNAINGGNSVTQEKLYNYLFEFYKTDEDKLHSSILYGPLN